MLASRLQPRLYQQQRVGHNCGAQLGGSAQEEDICTTNTALRCCHCTYPIGNKTLHTSAY